MLTLFLIHDIEPINTYKYKLFVEKYREINNTETISLFFNVLELKYVNKTCILNLTELEQRHHIYDTNFKPFVTAIPVNYKIIGEPEMENHQQIISEKVSRTFKQGFFDKQNVEFKNQHSIILNTKSITDNNNRFVVKKGFEYSVEFVNPEKIWLNLNYTNFSRTVKPVRKLGLKAIRFS